MITWPYSKFLNPFTWCQRKQKKNYFHNSNTQGDQQTQIKTATNYRD